MPKYAKTSSAWLNGWTLILTALSKGLDLVEQERTEAVKLLSQDGRRQRVTERLRRLEWSDLYERPAKIQLVMSAVTALPLQDLVPLLSIRQFGKTLRDMAKGHIDPSSYDPPASEIPQLARHGAAMLGQLRAMAVHQRSMSDLVAGARRGVDADLVRAIRIDPAVVAGPTARVRIHQAIFLGESKLLTSIASALRNPVSFNQDTARLHLALWFMNLAHQLKNLNEETAAELFIDRTHLYPSKGRADARRSLWRLIQRWKRDNATILR